MADSPVIIGLMWFFTLVTVVTPLALVAKFLPPWLERSMARRIGFHQEAAETLHAALLKLPRDDANYPRLLAQLEANRDALRALAPHLSVATPAYSGSGPRIAA